VLTGSDAWLGLSAGLAEVDLLVGGCGSDWFELAGAYSRGGSLDKAIIRNWNDGGDQDQILAYNNASIGRVTIRLPANDKVEIFSLVLTALGTTSLDLIAEISSTTLTGNAFRQNVIDHMASF
jgi:hypothetical protein